MDVELNYVKEIPDHPGYYVNEYGEVFSKRRGSEFKELSIIISDGGYAVVHFTENRINKRKQIHRLVAMAWIPNMDETKSFVNHKNGDKLDNNVNNLEWVTRKENSLHASRVLGNKGSSRVVIQKTKNGKFINKYKSAKSVEDSLGIPASSILAVCNKRLKGAGGFLWYYETEIDKVPIEETKEWIELDEYPGSKISRDGRVYSIRLGRIKKTTEDKGGYLSVSMRDEEGKCKRVRVHRLVALAYLSKPINKDIINHKDSNRSNNCVDNLEWVSHQENMAHAIEYGNKKSRRVLHYKDDITTIFSNTKEASEKTGIHISSIYSCISGRQKNSRDGSKWVYEI